MPTWISEDQARELQAKASGIRGTLHPLHSVTAAAQRLTAKPGDRAPGRRTARPRAQSWQDEAWDMRDLIGELRFLVNTLANRIAKGSLYVGEIDPGQPTAEPVQSEDGNAQAILAAFGVNQAGRSQIIRRLASNLLVAGEGWLLGIDEDALSAVVDDTLEPGMGATPIKLPSRPTDRPGPNPTDLSWRALSVSEVQSRRGDGTVEITLEDSTKVEASVDDVQLVRVWRPHDRRAWQADSACLAALPVLREIVGLTMRVAAEIDSRLAGAGVLMVKESVLRAVKVAAGIPPESTEDPLSAALERCMMEPLHDRDIPAALVPITVSVPDDVENPLQHLSFAVGLDAEMRGMREDAIRRLALSMDCPPEILTGTAAANHWGAWLVNEDTVTIHIEPPLALICDAITVEYLWPALIAGGMTEDAAQRFVVWYSVDHMVVRPNQFEEATKLHDKGLIDDDTYRRAGGFDLSDDPSENEGEDSQPDGTAAEADARPEAIAMALQLVRDTPSLASTPGLVKLTNDIIRLLTGDLDQPEPPATPPPPPPGGGGEDEPPAGELPTEPTTDGPPPIGTPE